MLRIGQNIFTKRYHHFWLTIGACLVVAAYVGLIPYAAAKGGDFVHLWIGGRLVAQGAFAHLYDPAYHHAILEANGLSLARYWGTRYEILGVFFYPPLTGLLYAPLGRFPLYWAQAIQAVINIGLGLCAAWLLTRLINQRLPFVAVLLLLFTFPSFFFAYALGQNGILTITLVLASWYWLKSQRTWWAGVALSLLVYKPNWLFALGWIPLAQRRWRMLLGIGSGLLLLLLIMVSVGGIAPLQTYLAIFIKLADLHDLPNYPLAIQYSILSLFRRYLGLSPVASLLGWSVALGIVGVTAWCIYRQRPVQGAEQSRFLRTAALTWVAAVCINPHLHHYDLSLLGVAMIVALSEWQSLGYRQRYWLGALFLLNHSALFLSNFLAINDQVPLPIFAMLGVWGWLFSRVWADSPQRMRLAARAGWRDESYTGQEA